MQNFDSFARTSAKAFRNRADRAAERAKELISEGQYAAASDAIVDAVRYDSLAKEYEFIVESYNVMEAV